MPSRPPAATIYDASRPTAASIYQFWHNCVYPLLKECLTGPGKMPVQSFLFWLLTPHGPRPAVVLKSKETRHLGAGSWKSLQNRIPLDVGTVCRDQQNSFVGRDPGPSPCGLSSTGKHHGHRQGAPASSQTSLDAAACGGGYPADPSGSAAAGPPGGPVPGGRLRHAKAEVASNHTTCIGGAGPPLTGSESLRPGLACTTGRCPAGAGEISG